MLTDSGGFRVFSLTNMRKVDEDGVTFKSHIDGSMKRLTPSSIQIQENLGADIIMAFDECSTLTTAPMLSRQWNAPTAGRSGAWMQKNVMTRRFFGIVQGGIFDDLRAQSAQEISSMGFPGHAIGGSPSPPRPR